MAKNAAAVELGRLGNAARQKKLSPERRREIARLAAKARWAKPPTSIRPRHKEAASA